MAEKGKPRFQIICENKDQIESLKEMFGVEVQSVTFSEAFSRVFSKANEQDPKKDKNSRETPKLIKFSSFGRGADEGT